jgi:endonuclease/exonuclease/phosphatase family metal-dependent hydrolase
MLGVVTAAGYVGALMLTVATWNLYLGADLSRLFDVGDAAGLARATEEVAAELAATRFEERAGAIAAVLAREAPDVVGLQEVARWSRSPAGGGPPEVLADFLPTLLAELAARGLRYDVHASAPAFGGAMPVEGRWMELEGRDVTLVRAGADVRMLAESTGEYTARHAVDTGLPGVSFPIARGWGRLDLEVTGTRLVVVNTHLEAWDRTVREAQRDELLASLADADCPVVVVGDFNASPREVGMPAPYLDAWTAAGGDPGGGFTCGQAGHLGNGASSLRERIDYVWVRGLRIACCRVAGDRPEDRTEEHRLWPSDHAAVVAVLEP